MRVFIAGIDGYLGWPLALRLTSRGHTVFGLDDMSRRRRVSEAGGASGIQILQPLQRSDVAGEIFKREIGIRIGTVLDHKELLLILEIVRPDCIVHLGEIPSAPYSMASRANAIETVNSNVVGTINLLWAMRKVCPNSAIVKLGTMGEFGTPPCPIPEGDVDMVTPDGGIAKNAMFPRDPGSIYHATKVADTVNIRMLCKIWGFRATDIQQGVVYGVSTPEIEKSPAHLATRFDFDATWGTAINRFCAQAIVGIPITPYGHGGQKRGFLPLEHSINCMTLIIENPPQAGEYRSINQFEDAYTISNIAERVSSVAEEALGYTPQVSPIENPRVEAEDHFYEPEVKFLKEIGYTPELGLAVLDRNIERMLLALKPNAARMRNYIHAMKPQTKWR